MAAHQGNHLRLNSHRNMVLSPGRPPQNRPVLLLSLSLSDTHIHTHTLTPYSSPCPLIPLCPSVAICIEMCAFYHSVTRHYTLANMRGPRTTENEPLKIPDVCIMPLRLHLLQGKTWLCHLPCPRHAGFYIFARKSTSDRSLVIPPSLHAHKTSIPLNIPQTPVLLNKCQNKEDAM